ncbi:MAG: hypothetical protein IPP38_14670 [Bacteroidetes bacterium]|nr:hypothetical protein [Bacteroidota bacterium]
MNLNTWFDGDTKAVILLDGLGYQRRWKIGHITYLCRVTSHVWIIVLLMSNKYSDKLIEEVSRYTVCGC